jgi:transcriptional regulator with XRE-family HTH domain
VTESPKPDLDLDAIAVHVREKMKAEQLSLRAAAVILKCSPATLSRILSGSRATSYPDAKILFTVISWVGKSIGDFETKKRLKQTSIAEVEVHLRALPGLTDRDVQALLEVVRAAHEKGLELGSTKSKKGQGPNPT